jgi:LPXTG-motif cell wall-anchored protein
VATQVLSTQMARPLPATGSASGTLTLVGSALLLAGAALVLAGRRADERRA